MLFLALVLAVILAMILAEPKDKPLIIRSDKFIMPDVTPVPPIEEINIPWEEHPVMYDVPLDDDLQYYITDLCGQYNIDPALVYAIIERESDFNSDLVADNGNSWGLMQVYSLVHMDRCIRLGAWNLLDPRQNIRVGVDYLAELMETGKPLEWVLMAYNGGASYADEMMEDGKISNYAVTVMDLAEKKEVKQ